MHELPATSVLDPARGHRDNSSSMAAFEVQRVTRAPRTGEVSVPVRGHEADEILAALRRWTAEVGRPPTCLDLDPSRARRLGDTARVARFEAGSWPTTRMVCSRFGTFNDALRAAGLPARPTPGRKANLRSPHEILAAIRAWTLRHGDPPVQTDWDPFRARRTGQAWRVDRYTEGDWPSLPTVRKHFGGLPAAIHAAGLEPAPQYEAPADRAARRARNRLALVRERANEERLDGQRLRELLDAATQARSTRDPIAAEEAFIALAGCALGLADEVRERRLRAGGRRAAGRSA